MIARRTRFSHRQQELLLKDRAIRVDFRSHVVRVRETHALEILINTVDGGALAVATKNIPWPEGKAKRSSVNSSGYGGANGF
jgi:hypothetical protein